MRLVTFTKQITNIYQENWGVSEHSPKAPGPFPRGGSSWPAGANVKHHLSLPDSGGLKLLLYVRLLALLLTAARPLQHLW